MATIDIFVTSKHLGNSDLTSDDNNRDYNLNGSLSGNSLTIKNAGGNNIIQFRGDRSTYIEDGVIGHRTGPLSSIGYFLNNNVSWNYGFYSNTDPIVAHYTANQTAKRGFFARRVQNAGIGFIGESNLASGSNVMFTADIQSSGTCNTTGFNASAPVSGAVTGGDLIGFKTLLKNGSVRNIGLRVDVSGATTENLAIDIISGDIKVPSGGIGLSETLNFGGGGSGDVASMTYEKGILISRTLVP